MPRVTVDRQAMDRLVDLQELITQQTETDVSRSELIAVLIQNASADPAWLVDGFRSPSVPLSEAEKAAMGRGRISSGVETGETDVDKHIYD